MKFEGIEITGTRRVVFKSYKKLKDGEIQEKTTIWRRIQTESYDGEEDLDDYFQDFVWVDEDRDRVRSDIDMISLLKRLQYSDRYRLWSHNETINVEQQ